MIPDHLQEFIRSMQVRIKNHQDLYNRYKDCGAFGMAETQKALAKSLKQTLEDLHKLQAKELLDRSEEENEKAYQREEHETIQERTVD